MHSKMLQQYFFPFPTLENEEEDFFAPLSSSDLSVYEDKQNIVVEASMPGLSSEEIDVTFHKGTLMIRGSKKEEKEDKDKKYYRRANRTYSYRITVPGNVDENTEPVASYKNGIMRVHFPKQQAAGPKRIAFKSE
jgi:HSP20 family protein